MNEKLYDRLVKECTTEHIEYIDRPGIVSVFDKKKFFELVTKEAYSVGYSDGYECGYTNARENLLG
jgi:hypothetical protein